MTTERPQNPDDFLPLTSPVFHILLALADCDRHGYAILREIEDRTGGAVSLGTGTMYTALKRMLNAGLIEQTDRLPNPNDHDERRTYYRVTKLGARVARAETARMDALVGMARTKQVY